MNFENFVTNAPKLLFNLGWVLAGISFIASAMTASKMPGNAFVPAILIGISSALWSLLAPWIAAAVLWRIDRFLEARK